jgi:aromatic ring-opening dioxygenase catalytic subunit (LigB family)
VVKAVDDHQNQSQYSARNEALKAAEKHPYFRRAHPRAEHWAPIFVAAGAGDGAAKTVYDLHGHLSFAFGF